MSHDSRFERVFDAALEDVFDAFTDPEGLHEMYGMDEPSWIVESEGELRVGGEWRVAFGPSRTELYRQTLVFRVIDRPHRIVFVTTEKYPDGASFDVEVEVTFEDRAGQTVVQLVQRGFPTAELRDQHEIGLSHAFDQIERVMRSKPYWEKR